MIDSIVRHFALLGVTPELASQWDDYVQDWCQEYSFQNNLPHKDDVLVAMQERDKPPLDGNYTILECIHQRLPAVKIENADNTHYQFPAKGQKGHGQHEELEDNSDLFPDLPFGMQPVREAPPPYQPDATMDES